MLIHDDGYRGVPVAMLDIHGLICNTGHINHQVVQLPQELNPHILINLSVVFCIVGSLFGTWP